MVFNFQILGISQISSFFISISVNCGLLIHFVDFYSYKSVCWDVLHIPEYDLAWWMFHTSLGRMYILMLWLCYFINAIYIKLTDSAIQVNYVLTYLLSTWSINYEKRLLKSPCIMWIFLFSLQFYEFLHHVFWCSCC